jgi:hypothetical protein
MDPEARRRACVAFRAKLSRDTGVILPAAACEALLGLEFMINDTGEEVTVQSNPGRFYAGLGQGLTLVHVRAQNEQLKDTCMR